MALCIQMIHKQCWEIGCRYKYYACLQSVYQGNKSIYPGVYKVHVNTLVWRDLAEDFSVIKKKIGTFKCSRHTSSMMLVFFRDALLVLWPKTKMLSGFQIPVQHLFSVVHQWSPLKHVDQKEIKMSNRRLHLFSVFCINLEKKVL